MKIDDMLKSSLLAQKKAIEESRAPKQGPYYWIPKEVKKTKNGIQIDWDIYPWFEKDSNDDITHLSIWPEALETLAYNLKIPKTNLRNLGMSHTALPRGRVGLTADGVYTILHGDNSPPPHTLDAVINAYSLRELNRKGKVKAIVDHHEKIATDDLMALKKAIGTDFNLESEEPDMSWFDNLD